MNRSYSQDRQQEELEALESIFEEEGRLQLNNKEYQTLLPQSNEPQSNDAQLISGEFWAQPHLLETKISVIDGDQQALVGHLPPIVLGFELPLDYPDANPPRFNLICKWLSNHQLSKLCVKLDELWLENMNEPILYSWIDFLQQDSLTYLGLGNELDIKKLNEPPSSQSEANADDPNVDERALPEIQSRTMLFNFLLEYEKTQLQLEFEKHIWTCEVCYCEKPGSQSFRFYECQHVFCADCMTQHFTVRINDGDVRHLTCPTDKCETQAHPLQLKGLLPKELYDKYENMLLQNALDTMLDVTHCPRPDCSTAVLLDPDSSLASCTACNFVFCKNCRMTYHGIHPCNVKKSKLMEKLENSTQEDIDGYKDTYGTQFVEALLRECASLKWVQEYTDPCPACGVKITKADGCNKMTCTKCKAYFCWICKAVLPRFNPYSHFKNSAGCHLFPGEEDLQIEFEDIGFDMFD